MARSGEHLPDGVVQRVFDAVPTAVIVLLATWTLAFWAGLALRWRVEVIGAVTLGMLVLVAAGALATRTPAQRPGQHANPGLPAGSARFGRPVLDPAREQELARERHAARRTARLRSLVWRAAAVLGTGLVVLIAARVDRVLALFALLLAGAATLVRWWWQGRGHGLGRADRADGAGGAYRDGADGADQYGDPDDADRAEPAGDAAPSRPGWWWLPGVGLAAAGMAVLSTQFARPDGDDVYFVSFSTYVAQQGVIPLRDTLMSPQRFPALAVYDPPLHSWESLIGLIARITGVEAPTTTYSVVLPVMVAVFVLTLARLIRTFGVPYPMLGLVTSLGLLLLDGAHPTSFGFLWMTRLWVGKIVLVSIVVPMLMIAGRRWLDRGRSRDLLMLIAASVAGLGVSSSAVFIVPLVLLALGLAGLVLHRARAAWALLIPLVAPLTIGVLTVVLRPVVPGPPQALPSSLAVHVEPLVKHTTTLLQVFVLGRWHLLVFVCALTLGLLGLRRGVPRAIAVALLTVFAVVVSPPVNALLLRALPSLDAVMWRMWFVVPMPLLFAALPSGVVAVVTGAARAARAAPWWARHGRTALALVAAAAAAGGFAAYGPSILSSEVGTHRSSWLAYKTDPGGEEAYRFIAAQARPGDVVLSPAASARLVPIITSHWFAVAPRLDYLRSGFYRSLPQVHAVDRLQLQGWVRGESTVSTPSLKHDLDLIGVDLVCTNSQAQQRADQMVELGWRQTADGLYACFRR